MFTTNDKDTKSLILTHNYLRQKLPFKKVMNPHTNAQNRVCVINKPHMLQERDSIPQQLKSFIFLLKMSFLFCFETHTIPSSFIALLTFFCLFLNISCYFLIPVLHNFVYPNNRPRGYVTRQHLGHRGERVRWSKNKLFLKSFLRCKRCKIPHEKILFLSFDFF